MNWTYWTVGIRQGELGSEIDQIDPILTNIGQPGIRAAPPWTDWTDWQKLTKIGHLSPLHPSYGGTGFQCERSLVLRECQAAKLLVTGRASRGAVSPSLGYVLARAPWNTPDPPSERGPLLEQYLCPYKYLTSHPHNNFLPILHPTIRPQCPTPSLPDRVSPLNLPPLYRTRTDSNPLVRPLAQKCHTYSLICPQAAPDVGVDMDLHDAAAGELGFFARRRLRTVLSQRTGLYEHAELVAEDLGMKEAWVVYGRKYEGAEEKQVAEWCGKSKEVWRFRVMHKGAVSQWRQMERRLARMCVDQGVGVREFDAAVERVGERRKWWRSWWGWSG